MGKSWKDGYRGKDYRNQEKFRRNSKKRDNEQNYYIEDVRQDPRSSQPTDNKNQQS